jgi:hypothetical protein
MSITVNVTQKLLCVTLLIAAQALAVELPSSGSIDGTVALLFSPVTADAAHTPLPAEGCEVHVTPADALAKELLYPCNAWFQPPARGRYLVWLEQGALVSGQNFLMFDFIPFRDVGRIMRMPMKPAGLLRVEPRAALGDGQSIRILSLQTSESESRAYDRRLSAERARSPVRAPAGAAIAGVFDAGGHALSLSRPVDVIAGRTVAAVPRPPERGTDILLSLVRSGHPNGRCQPRITLDDGSTRDADALLEAWDRVVAVWYGVDGARARIVVDCSKSRFESAVALPKASVLTIRDRLP